MILQDKGAKNCKNNQKLCSCSLPLLADVQSALQLLLNTKKKPYMKSLIAMLIPTVPTTSTYIHFNDNFSYLREGYCLFRNWGGHCQRQFCFSFFFKYLLLFPDHAMETINQRFPVPAHGWIGQFQVDLCLCGKSLCAKLNVRHLSTRKWKLSLHMSQVAHQAEA